MTETEKINLSNAIDNLVTSTKDLLKFWNNYLAVEYNNGKHLHEREYFDDMEKIAGYIAEKWTIKETGEFEIIFNTLEEIFTKYDPMTCSIISAGLLESIHAHKNIDSINGFDQWLKPITKDWWDGGLEYWEGKK